MFGIDTQGNDFTDTTRLYREASVLRAHYIADLFRALTHRLTDLVGHAHHDGAPSRG
jgi:hypothetical protein